MKDRWSLDGRVALVTGSSAGIGRATALELASWGATVVVNARSEDGAQAVADEIGGSALALAADLADAEQAGALVDRVVERCGRIDVLVNNAGHSVVVPSDELPLVRWQRALDLMLTAPFVCSQRAGRHMVAQGAGVIVNVASIFAHSSMERRAAYAAVKHGLIGLTRTLAVEWAQQGVRVVSVDPAFIATELVETSMRSGGFDIDALIRRTPAGRLGTPDEVARVIAFMASDAASYMTGASTIVDGGWLAYGGW
jgi:NAD(P)-dependent dehydrogenase (short-subunit alcohol dehydrogenase family)